MEDLTCVVCGRSFKAPTIRAKYCSRHCANRSRYPRSIEDRRSETNEDRKRVISLYDSELSVKDIAKRVKRSPDFVYGAWREAGLPTKRLNAFQKEVKRLRDEGMCSAEIAEATGKKSSFINQTCKAIGEPFSEEEKQKSIKLANIKAHRTRNRDARDIQKQSEYISRHYPKFEYISGFIGGSGTVELRCKECGNILKRTAGAVRNTKSEILCPVCGERRKQEEAAKLEAERWTRQEEKIKAFWKQPFQQISIPMSVCKECGTYYISTKGGFCSDECRRKHANRIHDRRLMRARRIDKSITLTKLYKRDHGVCWLCGGKCDYNDYSKDENGYFVVGHNYPSIDHVYPLSKGGNHEWGNVKLAHHYCNTVKNDKVVAYG